MDNKAFYLGCLHREHDLFKKVFRAMPEEALDRRPHPRSRSARELMGHIIGHSQDLVELAGDGIINHRNVVPFDTVDEAIALLEESHSDLAGKVEAMDADTWATPAKFMAGDHLIAEAPVRDLVWLMHFDSIHHRGQLSTYIRPAGGKVPAMYGPSADDNPHG